MTVIEDWTGTPLDALCKQISTFLAEGWECLTEIEEVQRRLATGEATPEQIPPDVMEAVKNPPPDPWADVDTP